MEPSTEPSQSQPGIPDSATADPVVLLSESREKLGLQIGTLFSLIRGTYLDPTDVKQEDTNVIALIRETGEESENEDKEPVFNTVKYYVQGFEEDLKSQEVETHSILDEPLNSTICQSPNSYLTILIFLLHIVRTRSGFWKNDCFPHQSGILEEMLLAYLYTETWTGTSILLAKH